MVWFTTLLLPKIYVCTASYPLFNEPTENRDTSKWVSIFKLRFKCNLCQVEQILNKLARVS